MDKQEEENRSNYILEFSPFRLGSSDKWCPKVLIKDINANETMPLLWDIALDSEYEANEYANKKIVEYINSNIDELRD